MTTGVESRNIQKRIRLIEFDIIIIIIIIIIHEFHRDASFEQNFRAAMCYVLHYSCNVNDSNQLQLVACCASCLHLKNRLSHGQGVTKT